MTSKRSTNSILKKLKLNTREGDLEDLSDDSEESITQNPNEEYNSTNARSTRIQFSPANNGTENSAEVELCRLSQQITEPQNNLEHNSMPISAPFLKKPVKPVEEANILRKGLKFGTNQHPYFNVWLTVLAITGAPVLPSFANHCKNNKFKMILFSAISLTLLVIYHFLFLNSTIHLLNSLTSSKGLYDSVWLQIYPIVFNLAVVIVADVMWIIGLGSNCWMSDIIDCFKEMPPRAQIVNVNYDYFGGEYQIINNAKQVKTKKNERHSQLKVRAVYMWKLINFFLRQLLAFGCCFTYLYVSYHFLKPIEFNLVFVSKLINICITCSAWLTILWIYMTICQVLCWRFRDFNDCFWQFRRHRKLPDMRQFGVLSATYQHYLKSVTIVDDFFKYWIVGIFGVLFFQTALYFQYVINAFENWPPSLQLLSIPLITMPFLSSLLLLIKRTADVNAVSKELDQIIVEICLHCKTDIPDNLYKKIKFFMLIVSEGSSLTLFGLVNITKKFMGTAIVFIFSYTLILHEFTPKESICETIIKNNYTSFQ